MDKNETLCGNFPTDLSPQQPYTYDCGGNCSACGMSLLSHDSAVRGWPAATELSDRMSPSGLPLSHRRPVWQLLLLKAVPPLWENLPQCWQLIKKAARVAKPETDETLQEKDLPGRVTSIYWCETHDFTVISTRSLEKMSDQHATKQSLYDLNASLHYDSSFSLQKWLFSNTQTSILLSFQAYLLQCPWSGQDLVKDIFFTSSSTGSRKWELNTY